MRVDFFKKYFKRKKQLKALQNLGKGFEGAVQYNITVILQAEKGEKSIYD